MESDSAEPRINVARLTYAALAQAGEPISSGEIQRRTGANIKTIQAALCRLKQEGLVIKCGTADWNTKWSLKSKRNPMLPERRGKSAGSRKALKLYGGNGGSGARNLRNLKNVKLTPDGKFIPQPKPKTALEQAWGWVPTVNDISAVDSE